MQVDIFDVTFVSSVLFAISVGCAVDIRLQMGGANTRDGP